MSDWFKWPILSHWVHLVNSYSDTAQETQETFPDTILTTDTVQNVFYGYASHISKVQQSNSNTYKNGSMDLCGEVKHGEGRGSDKQLRYSLEGSRLDPSHPELGTVNLHVSLIHLDGWTSYTYPGNSERIPISCRNTADSPCLCVRHQLRWSPLSAWDTASVLLCGMMNRYSAVVKAHVMFVAEMRTLNLC